MHQNARLANGSQVSTSPVEPEKLAASFTGCAVRDAAIGRNRKSAIIKPRKIHWISEHYGIAGQFGGANVEPLCHQGSLAYEDYLIWLQVSTSCIRRPCNPFRVFRIQCSQVNPGCCWVTESVKKKMMAIGQKLWKPVTALARGIGN
jgi:hypothetical protein